jgi:hypothetical protein
MLRLSSLVKLLGGTCVLSLIFITAFSVLSFAQQTGAQPNAANGFDRLQFLLGDWVGEGGGDTPGKGSGDFSFAMDLQNKIMIRKSFSEYPATENKPAYRHDDLTIIYQTPDDTLRAIYFDNEGHVINYIVNIPADQKSAVFVSAPCDPNARYRLTYALTEEKKVAINFEIAPPGQPEAFSTYIEATAHKKL